MIQIVLLSGLVALAHGFSGGAPLVQCTAMTPGHYGVTAMASDAPYTLDISTNSNIYRPGQNITITLRGRNGETFKGFMIMARTADCVDLDVPIGRFYLPPGSPMKTLTCIHDWAKYKNNTVTHINSEDKSSVTFVWVNQRRQDELLRPIYFKYTVVQNYVTYWANVSTETLFDTYKTGNTACAGSQAFGYVPATTKMPYPTTEWVHTHAPTWPVSGAAKHEITVYVLLVSAILLLL